MKIFILILSLIGCSICVFAQSPEQISTWLYNLPIKEHPTVIKKALQNNNCFLETDKNISYYKYSFKGIILKPQPSKAGTLDSSKVHLRLLRSETKKRYSGLFIKELEFEYFSIDSIYLKNLFATAYSDLKKHSKEQTPLGYHLDKETIGEGTEFIYKNNSTELSEIIITYIRHSNEAISFMVRYRGSIPSD